MITNVIKGWFSGKGGNIIPADRYKVSAQNITDQNALKTIQKLQKNGYEAYIVGGAVRDILLGFHPKDFDITTSASLTEITSLFPYSRIIGQRFPIVHVYYPGKNRSKRRDYVEVASLEGAPYEDAQRRDFTINGLMYDPINEKIYDAVGGCDDILNKKLRLIGTAKKRLPEDPQRILRALRLSTKLGLTMSAKLQKQLNEYVPLLNEISQARIADEFQKVLYCGAGARILQQWQQFGVCDHILPVLKEDNPMFFSALAENDRRLAENRVTSYSFIVAALFWQDISKQWHDHRAAGISPVQAMERAVSETDFRENMIIPMRRIARAKDLYFLQAQMENTPTRRRVDKILSQYFFDRALAFAAMRQDPGAAQTASWWSQMAQGGEEERERLLLTAPITQKRKRRKRGKSKADKADKTPPAPQKTEADEQ